MQGEDDDATEVAVDRYHLTTLRALAVLETGQARAPVVTVEYEGIEPPLELLSCLRLLGFAGLVPQPPPSSAIDWGVAGSTPGSPTIRPFRATVRSSLTGGAHTADRATDAVRLVLEQLAPRPAAPEAPAPPVSPTGRGGNVQVVVDRDDAAGIRSLLAGHGTVLEEEATTWTAEVAYRGQRSETRHPAVRLRAAVASDEREALLAALSQRRLRSVELDS